MHEDEAVVGPDSHLYFRLVHGRQLNVLNPTYLLPADADEIRRSELHHRMLQFVFSGKNYVGPVKQALQFGQQRRILDLGAGGELLRAIDMADEFPRAEVIGVDLAPIQPRTVPPNCTFELCDLEQWNIPYPDDHFDLIQARSMHVGIRDYPRFLSEVARLLRPGGLVLIIEPSLHTLPLYPNLTHPVSPEPSNAGVHTPTNTPPATIPSISPTPSLAVTPSPTSPVPAQSPVTPQTPPIASTSWAPAPARAPRAVMAPKHHGWETLWETYRSCLRRHGIDITVPERLTELLAASGCFESITSRDGNIPVGFWPTDESMRTIGELQWMDYELLLPALKPFFLSVGLSDGFVDKLIADAQYDLYYPPAGSCRTARIHIVHATKVYQ